MTLGKSYIHMWKQQQTGAFFRLDFFVIIQINFYRFWLNKKESLLRSKLSFVTLGKSLPWKQQQTGAFFCLKLYLNLRGRRQKSEGREENWGRAKSAGRERGKAPIASPLFIWSFLFSGERIIAIGSFLLMCQSLPHTNF